MLFLLFGCFQTLGYLLWSDEGGPRSYDSGTSNLATGLVLLAGGLYLCIKSPGKKA
ncbi:MAG TPA: hypothetical protein VJ715_16990 [Pyrinomonadaceae bacterium]|nr:hypothetical protein [Pyrinomonadaceae bacterium]